MQRATDTGAGGVEKPEDTENNPKLAPTGSSFHPSARVTMEGEEAVALEPGAKTLTVTDTRGTAAG